LAGISGGKKTGLCFAVSPAKAVILLNANVVSACVWADAGKQIANLTKNATTVFRI
jgi:hypothetical protein